MPDLPLTPTLLASPHRFLFHTPTKTAILADLHLGIDASLHNAGIYLPANLRPLQQQWSNLLAQNPAHIIIAGDLFDQPAPPPSALDTARHLFDQIPPTCRLTLLPGNHDPAADALQLLFPAALIRPSFSLDTLLISHGHISPDQLQTSDTWSTWIVGHQHPTVTLASSLQSAKMPCFARGKFLHLARPRTLILLPAFNPTSLGTNLLTARHWLLPIPRPAPSALQIAGIIPRQSAPVHARSPSPNNDVLTGLLADLPATG